MNTLQRFLSRFMLGFILCITPFYSCSAEQISIDELAEALLSQMSPEEQEQLLRETEELFKSLSPEELMELGKASEDFLREELKKEGLDLLPIEEPQEEPSKPTETPTAQPALQPQVDKEPGSMKPIVKVDSKLLDRAKSILNDTVDMISEVEQRAESTRAYKQQLTPLIADLDLLSSFLNIVNQYKLVRYFADEDHKKTYEHIVALYNQLNQNLDSFRPEEGLDATNPYHELGLPTGATPEQVKKQYVSLTREYNPDTVKERLEKQNIDSETVKTKVAKARNKFDTIVKSFQRIQTAQATEQAFQKILRALQQALYTHNIQQGIKNILEAHAPQALKQAEEAEQRAEQERKKQKAAASRYPSYSPPVFERQPQMMQQGQERPGFPGRQGGVQPTPSSGRPTPPPAITPTKPTDKKTDKKDGKKTDKKKDDKKKPEEKIVGEKNFYQALGVSQNASVSQIKQAHAQKNKLYQQGNTDALKDWPIIKDAYDILQDTELRKMYNAYLKEYLPKEAREKVKEYKKTIEERRKREEERGEKLEDIKEPDVQTAAQARNLYFGKITKDLNAASAQLGTHIAIFDDFKTFLQKPYNANELPEIIAIKDALQQATGHINTTMKALQDGRTNRLLQADQTELNRFIQQSLQNVGNFFAQYQTAIQQLLSVEPADSPSQEKKYILFGVPYPPAPPAAGAAAGAAQALYTAPQNIIDINPNKTNYVRNLVTELRNLQNITGQLQQVAAQQQAPAGTQQP